MKTMNQQVKIVIVGHVDHGKSTLIGRLLYDTHSLAQDQIDEIRKISKKRGVEVEWSFVLDSFQAERDQAVTIDTTQIWFQSDKRSYVIIDAPGHQEFLKNMVTGAAQADVAVLVVDAKEGMKDQSKRHAYLLSLLGFQEIVVVVNKMDHVNHSEERFLLLRDKIKKYLQDLDIKHKYIIPIVAKQGHNIVQKALEMEWYTGPTLLGALDSIKPSLIRAIDKPLRFPVQDVYRYDGKRVLVGRLESGSLEVGDELIFSPSNRTARVVSIEVWNKEVDQAMAGQSIGLVLDQPIYAERGDFASHLNDAPVLTSVMQLSLFWLSDKPLMMGQTYRMRIATSQATVTIQSIDHIINTDNLKHKKADQVVRNDMAIVTLRSRELLAIDDYKDHQQTGRAVLYDEYDVVGGGTIDMSGYANQREVRTTKGINLFEVDHLLTHEAISWRNGHTGGVFWLTGLSGAGKSTLAMDVEKKLFQKGFQVYVLDGDNVRKGLNSDLGFSPRDRTENIRRVGEISALMANAGLIVISAFISPYRSDRLRARNASTQGFHEIYIKADVESCEKRDPKGLYKKARAGEIKDFTGIYSPYEEPDSPELILDTVNNNKEECVERLCHYILDQTSIYDKQNKKVSRL